MKKAIQKFKNRAIASKDSSTRGREDESVKPKYQLEPEDSGDDSNTETEIDLHLRQRLKSMVAKKDENGPTTREEDEDPNANELFQSVRGVTKGPRREEQKGRQRHYEYPPHAFVNGPPSPRDEEEEAAADKLFAGASKSQKPIQPLPRPELTEAIGRIESAAKMSYRGGSYTARQPGEVPAADAIFGSRMRH